MMSVIPLPNLTTGVPPDTAIARDLPGDSGADGTPNTQPRSLVTAERSGLLEHPRSSTTP